MDNTEEIFQFGGPIPADYGALATIPLVSTDIELVKILKERLPLPSYLGRNWDALDECIQTLDWLPRGRVVIRHEEVPALEVRSLATYLDILRRGVRKWRSNPDRELIVIFPVDSKPQIMQALRLRVFH